MRNKAIVSEFGLISIDDIAHTPNKFLSAKIDPKHYRELEEFAKSDGGKDVLHFTSNGKWLKAQNFVGTIQTRSGFTLEILPKTASGGEANSKQIFIKLLYLLYKLPDHRHIDRANLKSVKNLDIFEIFIAMFLDEVGQIIKKGIKSDYVEQQKNLLFLKGKLILNRHIKQNAYRYERFFVAYDEYNQNCAENRLIKYTLKFLSRLSRDPQNIRRIYQYMKHMNLVEFSGDVAKDLSSIRSNRGMADYKNALIWSKVFLKGGSFIPFSGDTIAFAILYPMEKLFEGFVEWYLRKTAKGEVITQHNKRHFVLKDSTAQTSVRPDFIVMDGDEITVVADAKWKLNTDERFNQADFYQLYAYKSIFNPTKDLCIYYPKVDGFEQRIDFKYFDGAKIAVVPIDMEAELLANTN